MKASFNKIDRRFWVSWLAILLLATPAIAYLSFIGANWWFSGLLLLTLIIAISPPLHLLKRSPIDLPLLFLVFFSTLSLLITADPLPTTGGVMRLWAAFALFCLLYSLIYQKAFLRLFGISYFATGCLLALTAPFLITWPPNKIPFIPDTLYNILPPTIANIVHPNTIATAMIIFIPVGLTLTLSYFTQQKTLLWILFGLGTFILGLILLVSQSRGGYIAAAITILLTLLIARWYRLFIITVVIVLGLSIGLYTLSTADFVSYNVATTVDSGTFEFRLVVWEQSLWMIQDFPFTGVGIDSFNNVAERIYSFPTVKDPGAHNLYLHIAAEMGVFALVSYLAIVITGLRAGFKQVKKLSAGEEPLLHAIAVGSLGGWIGLHLHGLLDNTLWATRIAFLPWVLLALILSLNAYVEDKNIEESPQD